jgi:uncharacterized membrane protein
MSLLLALYIGSGLLLSILAVPMILRKVPPNRLYGFRVQRTLADPQLWYEVNAYSGRRLLAAGLGTAIGAAVLYFFPGLSLDRYALSCLAIVSILLGIGLVQSIQHLRRF